MGRMIRKKLMPWAIVAIALSSWPQRPSANVGVQTPDDNGVKMLTFTRSQWADR
jgi:hypothetical protein